MRWFHIGVLEDLRFPNESVSIQNWSLSFLGLQFIDIADKVLRFILAKLIITRIIQRLIGRWLTSVSLTWGGAWNIYLNVLQHRSFLLNNDLFNFLISFINLNLCGFLPLGMPCFDFFAEYLHLRYDVFEGSHRNQDHIHKNVKQSDDYDIPA